MSVPWITLTSKLNNGIEYMNSIESTKFSLLLSHINNALEKNNEQPFSTEELQKLEKALNLDNVQLEILLSTLIYITKLSKNFLMKPTILQEDLTDKMRFDSDKAEIFIKFWTENTKRDFENLQQKKYLQNVSWELNLETASDCDLKKAMPTSILQLEIKDNNDKTELITVDMNEEQLLKMYNEIEDIQNHLDCINK